MRIAVMNWMQVEKYLERDDRAVLPIGSIEQHAYLSLATDSILAERVAVEAAEPLGVPVFPAIAYGITPGFLAYPGTVSLRLETLIAVVHDALDSLAGSGFKRILVLNGHGGNQVIAPAITQWCGAHPGTVVKMHSWWKAPGALKKVEEIDPVAGHASWMENFPWTRMGEVKMPDVQKPMIELSRLAALDPKGVREYLGDGNFGGRYQRGDDDLFALWRIAIEEARELIESGW